MKFVNIQIYVDDYTWVVSKSTLPFKKERVPFFLLSSLLFEQKQYYNLDQRSKMLWRAKEIFRTLENKLKTHIEAEHNSSSSERFGPLVHMGTEVCFDFIFFLIKKKKKNEKMADHFLVYQRHEANNGVERDIVEISNKLHASEDILKHDAKSKVIKFLLSGGCWVKNGTQEVVSAGKLFLNLRNHVAFTQYFKENKQSSIPKLKNQGSDPVTKRAPNPVFLPYSGKPYSRFVSS